jgi:hypothetical protein
MSYEYPERFDQVEGGLKRITDITVNIETAHDAKC